MRSPTGISHDSALSSVVLPDPVPPATARSRRKTTAYESSRAYQSGNDPRPTSSVSELIRLENFLIVSAVPSIATGGTTAFTR